MQHDEKINKLLTEALDKLELAINEIIRSKNSKEKYNISKLGRAIGLITEFQKQTFPKKIKLKSSSPTDLTSTPILIEGQKEKVAKLSKDEVNKIDKLLLKNITSQWQKVAKIVGIAMFSSPLKTKEIPDIYYAQRIEEMAKKGIIESRGNLQSMRHSEVRKINKK